MNLKIYAVGSSSGISHEIEDSLNFIFDDQLPVVQIKTEEIADHTDGDLYVCNPSQHEPLLRYVPDNQIVLLNITPTPQFYLQIASLPKGSTVHLVNSQLPYLQKLIRSCEEMGIESLRFVPVPYMELPEEEVCRLLGEARYIAGVDRLLYEDIRRNPRYRKCIRPDAKFIGARRIPALTSIFHLVSRVNDIIRQKAAEELDTIRGQLMEGSGERLYQTYRKLDRELTDLTRLLRDANEKDDRLEKLAIRQLSRPSLFPDEGDANI